MALDSNSQIEEILGRKATPRAVTDGEQDISGGVEHVVGDVPAATLYLHATAAINVTVEVSPNGGTDWYELPESPAKFAAAGDDALHVLYNFNRIRLTGSTADPVQAHIREVM